MTEIEVPIEKIQQDLEHAAHGGHESHHSSSASWMTWSALLSALLAVMAAVAALQAGHQVNEAMVEQMKASDQWAYYQANSIKQHLAETRLDILEALGKESPADVKKKVAEYEAQKDDIKDEATEHEEDSELHFHKHETFAAAVTFFQIAIAVTAIAVLARRRRFLYVSSVFGVIGVVYTVKGFFFT